MKGRKDMKKFKTCAVCGYKEKHTEDILIYRCNKCQYLRGDDLIALRKKILINRKTQEENLKKEKKI